MFFDIGANIGNWALANIDKCDRIISVEASPTTFERTLSHARHDKITPLNYAVCNNGGKDVVFYQARADVFSTINKDWLVAPTSRFCNQPYTEIVCKTITIDDLIARYGVPDLIKIDVEGGEYECVSSLSTKVKMLCFEWASEVNEITFKCIDYLITLGFSRFYLQNGDSYTFRPAESDYYDIDQIKTRLSATIAKKDWGMIWCT
jgi:FkbM family methyltransferase